MRFVVETATGRIIRPEGGIAPEGCILVEAPAVVSRRIDAGMTYHYVSTEWVGIPAQLLAENWRRVRVYRDALLVVTDFIQLPDSPYDPTAKASWAVYRQSLRDVTSQPDPTAIAWPEPPSGAYPWLRAIPPAQVL